MNLQRVVALVKKEIKKMVREPAALFMTLLFPVVATLAFGAFFGKIGGSQETTYLIGVINMDSGEPPQQWSHYLLGNLTETEILEIQHYESNETAQSDLVQGKIQAILLIPENFSQSCNSFWGAPTDPSRWANITIPLYLDSGSMFATQAIPSIISQVLTATVYGTQPISAPMPIQIGSPSLVEARSLTAFDYMAPGLFAYAAIFFTLIVAQSFTLERENGLLRRINVTPTTPAEFMSGQVLSHMLVALLQVALVFGTAFLVGYRPVVGVAGLAFAFIIVSLFSLCCVGFGLITATVSKSSGTATGISFLFILPQMLLGTFVPTGMSTVAKIAARLVPSHYLTDALTSLFLRGAPISSPTILIDTVVVAISSVTVLLTGIFLFGKYGKA